MGGVRRGPQRDRDGEGGAFGVSAGQWEGGEVMEGQTISVYSPITTEPVVKFEWMPPPPPRKVSQKESRKKARYRRSQGIRTKGGK